MERYPENTNATLDDFRKCGWRSALKRVQREDYFPMWQELSSAAKQAIEGEQLSEGKVLWLLADACSMALKSESLNEPFAPFFTMTDGRRSVLPEDFEEDELEVVQELRSARSLL